VGYTEAVRTSATSTRRPTARVTSPPRRKLVALTEDEADIIVCLRRMGQKTVSLEDVLRRMRHAVDR